MGVVVSPTLVDIPPKLKTGMSCLHGMPFFRSYEWYESLLEGGIFDPQAVRILHDRDGTWALPMHLGRNGELRGLANYYSLEFGFSGTPKPTELPDIARTLMALAGSRACVVAGSLTTMQPDADRLLEGLKGAGYASELCPRYGRWYIPIRGDATAYLNQRSAKLRTTLRRGEHRLRRDHGVELRIVRESGKALEEGIRDYEAIYAKSWKPPENYPQFVPALIRTCAVTGRLRLGILYGGNKPIAAQIWISDGPVAHIYKLAHDPDFARYSAGSLLTAHLFRHAIDHDRVRCIDFGMGDEPYKQEWASHRTTIVELRAYNPWRPRGALGSAGLLMRQLRSRVGTTRDPSRDS